MTGIMWRLQVTLAIRRENFAKTYLHNYNPKMYTQATYKMMQDAAEFALYDLTAFTHVVLLILCWQQYDSDVCVVSDNSHSSLSNER